MKDDRMEIELEGTPRAFPPLALVPIEPTQAMLDAGHEQAVHAHGARAIWRAMLAVAVPEAISG